MTEPIGIFGTGAIGAYVGGQLAAAGRDVRFLCRPQQAEMFRQTGLKLETLDGSIQEVSPSAINCVINANDLAECETILVCVKSMDSGKAADELKSAGLGTRTIVSLQNGLDNADRLARALPEAKVVAGMVAFNVVRGSDGHYIARTEGAVYLGETGRDLARIFDGVPVAVELHADMRGIQFSKLCLNLNNALNTLSGLPLPSQLRDRQWRRLFALCIEEALRIARAEGLALPKLGKVPPQALPYLLRLPNFLFTRLAAKMLAMNPEARASMAHDLAAGKPSEVDFLNGKIVELGLKHSIATPTNEMVQQATHELFAGSIEPNQDSEFLFDRLDAMVSD